MHLITEKYFLTAIIFHLFPKKDICDICYEYKLDIKQAEGPEKDEIVVDYKNHKDKADVAYKALREAASCDEKEWAVIVMDLQQTQPVPKLSTGTAYYKRKLNFYNFCVHDAQSEQSYMYTWE